MLRALSTQDKDLLDKIYDVVYRFAKFENDQMSLNYHDIPDRDKRTLIISYLKTDVDVDVIVDGDTKQIEYFVDFLETGDTTKLVNQMYENTVSNCEYRLQEMIDKACVIYEENLKHEAEAREYA